jgi:hypothetical protein
MSGLLAAACVRRARPHPDVILEQAQTS